MNRNLIQKASETINYIDRNNDLTNSLTYENIIFFSFAEGGAMGCPGEIIIATKFKQDVNWYQFNLFEDNETEIMLIFPPLKSFNCGIFGQVSGIQEGWNHVYLGYGNHLLVRDDYYVAFQEGLNDLQSKDIGEIYANWRGIAQLLLHNYISDEQAYKLLSNILHLLDDKEYPQIAEIIDDNIDAETECIYDTPFSIAEQLHDADATKQLPLNVANFIMMVYKAELNLGNNDVACNIGSLYYTGRCGEQNYAKAVYYYTIAADAGCRQAQENLGYCYYYGRDIDIDYAKAFHYFALGAFDGHIRSLYKIGDMYRNGYYVKKNENEAFLIYCRCEDTLSYHAMSQVGADVMMRMGDCYFKGIGTDIDYSKALDYYQKAEKLFYERLIDGDFLIKGCYKHVIKQQEEARKNLQGILPEFDWI